MRRLLPFALLAVLGTKSVLAESDDEIAAHRAALGVAGAFTNEGFKLRDGHWTGRLQTGKTALIQVNLYSGNQYWFSAGASPSASRQIVLTVYDESGKPLPCEPYSEDGKAAAGFAPDVSGPYFVKLEEKQGAPTSFCILYSYK